MKRFLLFALALLLMVPARAQKDDPNVIVSSADGNVQLLGFSHFGYGFHIVRSDDFKATPSGELFLNILKLRVYPFDNLAIDLGLDVEYNFISSKRDLFYLDGARQVRAADFNEYLGVGGTWRPSVTTPQIGTAHSSSLDVFTLNLPLLARFMIGDVCVSFGGEFGFNLDGSTSYRYKLDNVTTRIREDDAKLNLFSYGLTAMADYDGLGLYVKFYPGSSSRLLPAGGTDLRYWTIGLVFGIN